MHSSQMSLDVPRYVAGGVGGAVPVESVPTGNVALGLGIASIITLIIVPVGFLLGVLAVVLGALDLRARRRLGFPAGRAAGAIACGGIAMALAVLAVGGLFAFRTSVGEESGANERPPVTVAAKAIPE